MTLTTAMKKSRFIKRRGGKVIEVGTVYFLCGPFMLQKYCMTPEDISATDWEVLR